MLYSKVKAFVIKESDIIGDFCYAINSPDELDINHRENICKAYWTALNIKSSNDNLDKILTPGRKLAFIVNRSYLPGKEIKIYYVVKITLTTGIDYNSNNPRKFCVCSIDEKPSANIVKEIMKTYRLEKDKSEKSEKYKTSPCNSDLKIKSHITKVIINDPAVVVFWSDDTKTIGKAMKGEEFNPEIGLAMAISKKYYSSQGYPNPRAAFKRELAHANDISKKTKEKKSLKNRMKSKSIFGEKTLESIREHLNAAD